MNDQEQLYTITNLVPEMLRNADGSYTPAYRVDFRTSTGHASYVTVPRATDQDQAVHAAVEAEAQRIVNTITRPVTSIGPTGRG